MTARAFLVALACTTVLTAPAAAQTPAAEIGVTAAVNADATGTPPAAPRRELRLGLDVYRDEVIETGRDGQAQLVFLDGSNLTVAPDSSLVLDEFAYDPQADSGNLVMSASKGVFRFVGGRISKQEPVRVRTPLAVIGIRGGVILSSVDPANGTTTATLVFGDEMTVTPNGGAPVRITRPGYSVTIRPGDRLVSPERLPVEELQRLLSRLEGRPNAQGGAPRVPTDRDVAAAPVTAANAGPLPTPPAPRPVVIGTEFAQAEQPAIQRETPVTQPTGPSGPSDPPPSNPPAPRFAAYNLTIDAPSGSSVPFVDAGYAGALPTPTVNPLYVVAPGGTSGTSRFFQVSFGLTGSGAGQSSVISLALGAGTEAAGSLDGDFIAMGRSGLVDGFFAFEPALGSLNGAGSLTALPSRFTLGSPDASSPFETSYTAFNTLDRATAPTDLGAERRTVTLLGYATAVADVVDRPNPFGVTSPAQILRSGAEAGGFSLALDSGTGEVSARMRLDGSNAAVFGSLPAAYSGANGYDLRFGRSGTGAEAGRSAYIDESRFAALESRAGGASLSSVAGGAATASRLYLLSAEAAPLPGLTPCDCRFAQWGWWGGTVATPDPMSSTGDTLIEDRIHLGTWLAGSVMAASDMPVTGNVTFSGHAVGTYIDGTGRRTIQTGDVAIGYDFGQRSGTMAINNFAGASFSGTISASSTAPQHVAGTLLSGTTVAGDVATIAGSFFGNGANRAAEIGGTFDTAFTEGRTTATGIFLARQP